MDVQQISSLVEKGFTALLVLGVGLPILKMMMSGKITGIGASKDGGLKIEMAKVQKRDETRYYRDRRIQEIDHWLDLEAREITRDQKRPLRRSLMNRELCDAALRAMTSDLLYELYDAVNQNDFKHKLSLVAISNYRKDKVEVIRLEYEDFLEDNGGAPCSDLINPTIIPNWEKIEAPVSKMVEQWTTRIAEKVAECCRKKISIYEEYREGYMKEGEEHELKIVDDCIEKNNTYIKNLGMVP